MMDCKRASLLTLIGAFGVGVVGCGGPAGSARTEIRYMAWGGPEQTALEQKFCDEFNAKNPDVHVRLLLVPGTAYKQKMILMLASRTAPDVIRVDHYDFPSLVGKDYFYDVSQLAARDPGFKKSDFFPQTIRESTVGGKFYGLNTMFGGQVIYYNRTMVEKAGLEDPYTLSKRGAWTYEKFREYAIAMTKIDSNGRPAQFGVQVPTFPACIPFIWGFGGDVLSADGKRCLMDSAGAARALQFLADLRWKDHCAPSPSQDENAAFSFESGKVGMSFGWSGNSVRYRKVIKDFEWDLCPQPIGPVGGASMVKGNQLVIYSHSAHPNAAWRFIRFLTSPEVETELYARLRRNLPSRIAVANSREFLDGTKEPHHPDVFVSSARTGRELPITDRWSEWSAAFTSELDDLFGGRDLDAARVLKRATIAANEKLNQEEGY